MPMNWHFECGSCGKEFPAGLRARENHCLSTGHAPPRFECDRCCRWFNSEDARWQHMNDRNHFAHECHVCNETFSTPEEVKEHEIDYHHHCADCDRTFNNRNNIKMVSKRRSLRGLMKTSHSPPSSISTPAFTVAQAFLASAARRASLPPLALFINDAS